MATTPILLLSGMTPDPRIFARLAPRLSTAVVVPWIEPLPRESIRNYACRLAASIDSGRDTVVCGVSFGGIVARELAVQLNAQACVLISSIRHTRQLPPWFRMLRPFVRPGFEPVLNAVGTAASAFPRKVRTPATTRLTKLSGQRGSWHRWATVAVLGWQAADDLDGVPVVQIHGDRDTTFPIRYVNADVVVRGGGHLLALTHADRIARILTEVAAGKEIGQ